MAVDCCIIGAGNVAGHLAKTLHASGVAVRQVWSRFISHAREVAEAVGAEAIDSLIDLAPDCTLYIIATPDNAIADIVAATAHIDSGIWVHTSGATPASVFEGVHQHYGVFYPLQTFTRGRAVDFRSTPMLIEGSDDDTTKRLTHVASLISDNVRQADGDVRLKLHIAAVFACNFANYMWTLADGYLHQNGLDFDLLKPIMGETLAKLGDLSPINAQTGPARRADTATIARHIEALPEDLRPLYQQISSLITSLYHEQN